jgi:hypothetical protein
MQCPLEVDGEFFLGTGKFREGVKGILPLGCLPHWGRVGVTLIPFKKNE